MDVNLVVFTSKGQRRNIHLKPGRYIVGRKSTAALRIPMSSVSREHCEIVHEGERLSVNDLGSSNGTFKNYARIENDTPLAAGDVIDIGGCLLTVQIDGQPAEIAQPEQPTIEDSLAETPPAGGQAVSPSGDLDETVAKAPGMSSLLGGDGDEDSSIFDFDFDFEDDEKP